MRRLTRLTPEIPPCQQPIRRMSTSWCLQPSPSRRLYKCFPLPMLLAWPHVAEPCNKPCIFLHHKQWQKIGFPAHWASRPKSGSVTSTLHKVLYTLLRMYFWSFHRFLTKHTDYTNKQNPLWAKILSPTLPMSVKTGVVEHFWRTICYYKSKALGKCVCFT